MESLIKLMQACNAEWGEVMRQIVREELTIAQQNITASASKDYPVGVEEAARITGFAIQTIYGLVAKNEIPFYKKNGRLFFFPSELILWIKSGDLSDTKLLSIAESNLSTRKRKRA